MADLKAVTAVGGDTVLEHADIETFESGLRGTLLRLSDDGYDSARTIWNAMIDHKPSLLVRCAGVADVLRAVDFARTHDILVAVRGGGHNIAGKSMCHGGLVIDLAPMQGMRVDPVARTARAQAGLKLGDFDPETQAFGLATTMGIVTDTGIAGLTLGGGYGWLAGKFGLACDNLLFADIVTADGRFLTASADENEELFWGLRGGGGNFGVVTSFEYQLHPVDSILGGMVIHPMTSAAEVLHFYEEFASRAPDELTTACALLSGPDGNPIVAIAVCYCGPAEEGEKVAEAAARFWPTGSRPCQPDALRGAPGNARRSLCAWPELLLEDESASKIDGPVYRNVGRARQQEGIAYVARSATAIARRGRPRPTHRYSVRPPLRSLQLHSDGQLGGA